MVDLLHAHMYLTKSNYPTHQALSIYFDEQSTEHCLSFLDSQALFQSHYAYVGKDTRLSPVYLCSRAMEPEKLCTHLCLQLMKYIVKLQSKGAAVADELTMLFTGDLNPVAAKAQRKVPVPEG